MFQEGREVKSMERRELGGGTEPGHLSSVVQADVHPSSNLLQESRSQVTCVYQECPGQREDSVG